MRQGRPRWRAARIILASAEGSDSDVVARRLHVTPGTVCKWPRAFRHRLGGLFDEPQPDAKRTITDEQVEQVVSRTLERRRAARRTEVRGNWRKLSAAVTRRSVGYDTRSLQPHRSETFKRSNDPLLVEKSAISSACIWIHPRMPRCSASTKKPQDSGARSHAAVVRDATGSGRAADA
jgi:transposase